MSRLYFAGQSTALRPWEEVLKALAPHYDAWEISAEHLHALPVIAQRFRELTPSYNMKYQAHAPLSDINIASPNERVRETVIGEIVSCIKTAGELGIPHVTFHPGFISPLTIDDRAFAHRLNRDSILRIDRAGKEHNVRLSLENMPKMFITIGTSFDALKEFVQGTEIKICFDFGHANIAKSLDGFFSDIPLLGNIHVHDNKGDIDSHLIPGDGTIDFNKYMRILKGYNGNFVFEAGTLEAGIAGKKRVEELIALAK